jgi:hypothetical protein
MSWKEIKWDSYPRPYSIELPAAIELAYERLTPEGAAILDVLVEMELPDSQKKRAGEGSAEDLLDRIMELPEWDQRAVLSINKRLAEATRARVAATQGRIALTSEVERLFERARLIDPTLTLDDPVALAMEVLRQAGEPVGISDEVLELLAEMRDSSAVEE